jgi:hypothetical protein
VGSTTGEPLGERDEGVVTTWGGELIGLGDEENRMRSDSIERVCESERWGSMLMSER